MPYLLGGAWLSLQIAFLAFCGGMVIGLFGAMAKTYGGAALRRLTNAYVVFFTNTPDIVTLGKGLGGGVPISAVLAAERACCFEYGDQGGTYNGNPLMTAVGIAVVQAVSDQDFLAGVRASGKALKEALTALGERFGFTDVRGQGLLWAVDLAQPRAGEIRDLAFDLGLLINAPRPNTLRFMPALNLREGEITEAMVLLEDALTRTLAT